MFKVFIAIKPTHFKLAIPFPRDAQRDCIAERYKERQWRKSKGMSFLRVLMGDGKRRERSQKADGDLPSARHSAHSF